MRPIRTDSFEEAYEVYEDLGSGQFAVVRRCKEKETGNEYAAKFVIKRRQNSSSRKGLFREKILQEIEILNDLNHTNIISLHDVFETNHEIILVLELVSGGELFEYISEKDHLSEEEAARFIAQILEGVEHFHTQNIVHLDLKPENVMLLDRNNCLIKIIDFGISRKLKPGEKVMETYGTPEFVAPEIIQYQPISTATDMWSIGVITYILLSGASPFLGDSKQETFANITNIDYSFDAEYFGNTSHLAKDFISKLFVKDVRKRATVKDCLDHPWIKPRLTKDVDERRVAQINIDQFKSFIARRRWKQSVRAISLCNKIIRKSQLKLSSTLSLENINGISFGKTLMDNGDDFVLTALLCAAEDGDLRNLDDLLKIASLDVNKGNKNKETALHLASANGKLEIIKLLKTKNVKLDIQDNNGENALHYSCRCSNYELSKQIIEFLVKSGLPIDSQNKNGETALHIATRYGCTEIVKYLCQLGANLDLQDDQLETALHIASWHGFPELVELFCNTGCDINKKNKEGETALIVACARGCIDSVKTLVDYKADLNFRDKRGNTGLHWAVRRHYTMIALLLIQAECNMDILDSNGETALHIACRESLLPIIQTMCALGCRVDIKNKREMTPLHTATEKNEINAVRCLCLAGQDLTLTNKDGLTAEQLANHMKFYDIANLLSSLRKEQNREVFIEQLIPNNETLRRLKVKVLGASGVGKTTLIGSMKCSYINSFFRRSRLSSLKSSKSTVDINSKTPLSSFSSNNLASETGLYQNFNVLNSEYTKGVEISQCTFSGSNHYSIWEFSGYEPYKIFYDSFLGDVNCIHLILYKLNDSLFDCFNQCVQWLEFLRARIFHKAEQQLLNGNALNLSESRKVFITQNTEFTGTVRILFIATHADQEDGCVKKEDGLYHSSKAFQLQYLLENYYANDTVFDLSAKHFVIDSRAAWETDMKTLINNLNTMKQQITEKLPKCTMFLNRTLFHLSNWRKSLGEKAGKNTSLMSSFHTDMKTLSNNSFQLGKYPILRWNQFVELIRENINPLASEVHLQELIYQLQLMGEVILLEPSNGNSGSMDGCLSEVVCFQPEWLCQQILGNFFAHERLQDIKPKNLNGVYSAEDLLNIYTGTCDSVSVLESVFLTLGLCATVENDMTGRVEYEFSSLNFLNENETMFSRFANNKSYFSTNAIYKKENVAGAPSNEKYVYTGFQLKSSAYHLNKTIKHMPYHLVPNKPDMSEVQQTLQRITAHKAPNQLLNLFYRIQMSLRKMTQNHYTEFDDQNDDKYDKPDEKMISKKQASGTASSSGSAFTHNGSVALGSTNSSDQDKGSPNGTKQALSSNRNSYLQSSSTASLNASHNNTLRTSHTNLNSYSIGKNNNFLIKPFKSAHGKPYISDNDIYLANKKKTSKPRYYFGTLIDIELFQFRFCTRLVRESCKIDCYVKLDRANADFIEIRACAPESLREELFYFVEDLYSLIEEVLVQSSLFMNLERHYIRFNLDTVALSNRSVSDASKSENKDLSPHLDERGSLKNLPVEAIYSPDDIIKMQMENTDSLVGPGEPKKASKEIRFVDLVCCCSENIRKHLIYGVDLPISSMNNYTRRLLCIMLDKIDPMGRDCNIFAVLLGLAEYLPKLDEEMRSINNLNLVNSGESSPSGNGDLEKSHMIISKSDNVLNEWSRRKPEQALIRNLILKIDEFGRKDCKEMIMNTSYLFQINKNQDSGIQNSSQTLF